MARERRIRIVPNTTATSPRVTFKPGTCNARVDDQIFWVNDDTEAHWPGLSDDNGVIVNAEFFMARKIAARDESSSFAPAQTGVLPYACSLHKDAQGRTTERGTITVADPL